MFPGFIEDNSIIFDKRPKDITIKDVKQIKKMGLIDPLNRVSIPFYGDLIFTLLK